jgi:hypothetical protein
MLVKIRKGQIYNNYAVAIDQQTEPQSLQLRPQATSRPQLPAPLPVRRLQKYRSLNSAENFDELFKIPEAALRYKQLLPTLLTSVAPASRSSQDSTRNVSCTPPSASTPRPRSCAW